MKFLNKISSSNFGSTRIEILCLGLFKGVEENVFKIQSIINVQIANVQELEK